MALAAKLQLRQSQSLVMTPQLLQSIRLLQFNHAELERFIDEEIERNPLLERAESEEETAAQPADEPSAGGETDWFHETERPRSAEAMAEKLDASLENIFPDVPGTSDRLGPDLSAQWKSAGAAGGQGASADTFDLEDMAAAAVTLRDHVCEQIALAFADPVSRLIAGELADALDDDGYMRGSLLEIAGRLRIDASSLD